MAIEGGRPEGDVDLLGIADDEPRLPLDRPRALTLAWRSAPAAAITVPPAP
jgi:hypothetical protein